MDLGIEGLGEATEIGSGGSAVVYRAHQHRLGRDVAVKVLNIRLSDKDSDQRRRFEREQLAMGRLADRQGVIPVYDSGLTASNQPYLIMPFYADGSLQDRLDQHGPIPPEEAAALLAPVARAIEAAHSDGIFHRDIKPANIMVTREGDTVVGDFGVARLMDSTTMLHSQTLATTPAFSAPEVFEDAVPSAASDVYSLGATLFALIVGTPAFVSLTGDGNVLALMRRIATEPIPDLRAHGANHEIAQLVESTMAKDPSERPASAGLFADLLIAAAESVVPSPADPVIEPVPEPPSDGPDHAPVVEEPEPEPEPARPAPAPQVGDRPPVDPPSAGDQRPSVPLPADLVPPQPDPGLPSPLLRRVLVAAAVVAAGVAMIGVLNSLTGNDDDGTDDGGTEAAEDGESEGAAVVDADDAENEDVGTGDDEDDGSPASPDVEQPIEIRTIEDLEAQWAAARSAVVESIVEGGFGIGSDNILRGPGGFEVDLGNCPADWSDTAGISSDTITIGHTAPLTGNLAAYGNIGAGIEAYFEHVNRNGGIDGRQVELTISDDQYIATETIDRVAEMLQAGDQPLYITTLGSPNSLAVYDSLNEQCVPQPFVMSGHPAWGDPENHPFTSGLQLSYQTEAMLWGSWIADNLGDDLPVTVAALVMDNDFGMAFETSFQRWTEDNPGVVSDFVVERHEPAGPTVTAEMSSLAAAEPDVYISMTAGTVCQLAIIEASQLGLTESAKALFTPLACEDANIYMVPAGDGADGWRVIGGGTRSIADPGLADDVYLSFVSDTMQDAGLDVSSGLHETGFAVHGWAHVELLRIASELPGGLSRTNVVLAMRALDLIHPVLYDGIAFSVNGALDAYYVEGSEVSVYDAGSQTWVRDGDIIDLNGQGPNCVWSSIGC